MYVLMVHQKPEHFEEGQGFSARVKVANHCYISSLFSDSGQSCVYEIVAPFASCDARHRLS